MFYGNFFPRRVILGRGLCSSRRAMARRMTRRIIYMIMEVELAFIQQVNFGLARPIGRTLQ